MSLECWVHSQHDALMVQLRGLFSVPTPLTLDTLSDTVEGSSKPLLSSYSDTLSWFSSCLSDWSVSFVASSPSSVIFLRVAVTQGSAHCPWFPVLCPLGGNLIHLGGFNYLLQATSSDLSLSSTPNFNCPLVSPVIISKSTYLEINSSFSPTQLSLLASLLCLGHDILLVTQGQRLHQLWLFFFPLLSPLCRH